MTKTKYTALFVGIVLGIVSYHLYTTRVAK